MWNLRLPNQTENKLTKKILKKLDHIVRLMWSYSQVA